MKKTMINIISNTFARFVPMAAAIILTPFILKQIGVENYGVWAIVISFVNISLMFDLGLGFATEKELAKLSSSKNDEDNPANFLFSLFPYQLLIAIFLTVLVAIALIWGLQWMKISIAVMIDVRKSMILVLILVFLKYWIGSCASIVRGLEKHYILFFRNCIYVLIYACLVLLILPKYKSVFGLILCDLLATTILLIVFIRYILQTIKFNLRSVHRISLPKKIFSFSRDAFTLQMCALFLFNFGKIILGGMVSAVEVGYYEIASKIFQILQNTFDQIARVFLPKAAKAKTREKIVFYLEEGTFYLLLLWGSVSIPLFICLNDFILLWLGDGFIKSIPIAIVLIISLGFIALSRMSLNIFMGIGQLAYYVKLRIGFTLFFIGLSFLLIPRFDALGLAYSMLIHSIFSELVITAYSFKFFGLSFWHFIKTRVLKVFLMQVLLGLIVHKIYLYFDKSYLTICGVFAIYNLIYGLAYYNLILVSSDKLFVNKKLKDFFCNLS